MTYLRLENGVAVDANRWSRDGVAVGEQAPPTRHLNSMPTAFHPIFFASVTSRLQRSLVVWWGDDSFSQRSCLAAASSFREVQRFPEASGSREDSRSFLLWAVVVL